MASSVLIQTDLQLPLFGRGKSRDTYDLGDFLLIVATDRICALDTVLSCGIPDKGLVMNRLCQFWFDETRKLLPNHLVATLEKLSQLDDYLSPRRRFKYPDYLVGRCLIVKKYARINIECAVCGYLVGAAWEEYRKTGTCCGSALPPGLQEGQELPEPVFIPATKAKSGQSTSLTMEQFKEFVDATLAEELRSTSLMIYKFARDFARARDIIIAHTRMEFGLNGNKLVLIDELLTPDSSCFWNVEEYIPGQSLPGYDKQFVCSWLSEAGWHKQSPPPALPPHIIEQASQIYRQTYQQLTGLNLLPVS